MTLSREVQKKMQHMANYGGKLAMASPRTGIPYPVAPVVPPSTYCYSASASTEMGAHCHTMPDGVYSSMHFHPGGNVLHSHAVMQVQQAGIPTYWDFDYNACPELCIDPAPAASITIGNADNVYYGSDAKEEPPAAKPKADVIWELLKGACVR